MKNSVRSYLPYFAVGLAIAIMAPPAQAGALTTSFEAPPGILSGSAIVEDGVLKLTLAQIDPKGSLVLDELDPGERIGSFTAAFKARVGGGTTRPAHGFSFVFGHVLPSETPFGEGGGDTTGLVISFDTLDSSRRSNDEGNDPGDVPGVIVKLRGAKIAAKRAENLKTDDRFVDVLIRVDPDGTLDVVYDGVKIYDSFAFGWTPLSGQFGFGAATSEQTAALNANHWIDDLTITTVPVTGAFVSSVLPAGQSARPDAAVEIRLENLSSQAISDDV